MFTATRSAAERIWPFLLVSSGTGRWRPNIVRTTPDSSRLLERGVDEAPHAREAGEVGLDELLRGLLRHADVLGERERRLAVEQRVVDDLGPPPQLVPVEAAVGAEHLERGLVVDVVAAGEGRGQRLVARQVRQHPQLDLRVVGRDQHVAGLGDEGAADLAAERRADRDVLQVRVAAAQPSGGGHGLVEHGVHATGDRVDQRRQRVDVGALQLRQAAPLEDQRGRSWVSASSSSTSTAVDGVRVVPVRFSTGSLSFSNRISPSCLGEPMLKGSPAWRWISAGQRRQLLLDAARPGAPSTRGVDAHAGPLEPGQDRHERQLEVAIDRGDADAVQLGREALGRAATTGRRVRRRSRAAPPAAGCRRTPPWRPCRARRRR